MLPNDMTDRLINNITPPLFNEERAVLINQKDFKRNYA
jgi:hypothetical protein